MLLIKLASSADDHLGWDAHNLVSNRRASVRFYTRGAGAKALLERHGEHCASIDSGQGLTIGLHPLCTESGGACRVDDDYFRSSEPVRDTVAKLKARSVVFRGDVSPDTQLLVALSQRALLSLSAFHLRNMTGQDAAIGRLLGLFDENSAITVG